MPATADPSTRRLSEVARHVVAPTGIVDTLWFEVEKQCREWGDEFDAWQDGLGQLVLGIREDGYFAATIGGVTLSIPRQVAKTFIVSRIVFAICAMYPNTTVLWTAHRTRTSTQTFDKLKGITRNPAIRSLLARNRNEGIRSANGEQEIRFKNDSVIMFGAREQGFGRGFDEVDIEVFDEAQILTEKALDDMIAATNQSRFPHGALLFYMGTPPKPTDPGEVFTNRRQKALAVKPAETVYAEHGDALYVECSADANVGREGGPSLDDIEQVAIANPSYPQRTPPVSIARLRENLASDESWRREGLGVWDAFAATEQVIAGGDWAKLKDDEGVPDGTPPTALAVDQWYDGTTAIGGAWRSDDGWHAEVLALDHVHDNAAVVDLLVKWAGKKIAVGVAGDSPAAAMIGDLRTRGVKVNALSVADLGKACVGFHADVMQKRITYKQEDQLDAAVAGAKKATIGTSGLWRWDRRNPEINLTPLMVITLARFAASVTKRKDRTGESVFR